MTLGTMHTMKNPKKPVLTSFLRYAGSFITAQTCLVILASK